MLVTNMEPMLGAVVSVPLPSLAFAEGSDHFLVPVGLTVHGL